MSLTAPFRNSSELTKGGRTFTYIPAAEVIERLNAVLGYGNWSYRCQLVHMDSDFVVVHGHLEALGAVYEQFGGQKINKNKQGEPIDLGDDVKGAASDAAKKAAQMIGVGLYLALGRGPTPQIVEEGAQSSSPPAGPAPSSATSAGDKTSETGDAAGGGDSNEPPAAEPQKSYEAAPVLQQAREALKK